MAPMVKHLPATRETRVQFLSRAGPLEKEMAIHSSTLAWKIPWTEEPDRLQSMGSQRVGHDWATSLSFTLVERAWIHTQWYSRTEQVASTMLMNMVKCLKERGAQQRESMRLPPRSKSTFVPNPCLPGFSREASINHLPSQRAKVTQPRDSLILLSRPSSMLHETLGKRRAGSMKEEEETNLLVLLLLILSWNRRYFRSSDFRQERFDVKLCL